MSAHEVEPATAELIGQLGLESISRQLATSDALDSKAWNSVAVGSIVLGLGAAASARPSVLAAATVVYAAAAVCAFNVVRVRRFKVAPEPNQLWRGFWFRPLPELHHALAESASNSYPVNAKLLKSKTRWVKPLLAAVAAETVIVLAGVVF